MKSNGLGSGVMVARKECGFDPHLPSKQHVEQRMDFLNNSFEYTASPKD